MSVAFLTVAEIAMVRFVANERATVAHCREASMYIVCVCCYKACDRSRLEDHLMMKRSKSMPQLANKKDRAMGYEVEEKSIALH